MRNKKVLEMTTIAMFATIIILMAWFPWIGFIAIPFIGISITIIHIPVIIGAMFGGLRMGAILGLIFGLSSWVIALIRATQPFDIMFQNPILSVLPRFLFGLSIWFVYALFKRLIKHKAGSIAVTILVVTLIHTLLVMGTALAMSGFYEDVIGEEVFTVLVTRILPIIAPFEMALAALVGTPIILRLMRSEYFKEERDSTKEQLNIDEK